jgi:hypothetical protein
LDSDAVVTVNHSLADVVAHMRRDLKWNMQTQPIAFNQDGPGWACKHTRRSGYDLCFNSGTIFWLNNNPIAENILWRWWNSSTVRATSCDFQKNASFFLSLVLRVPRPRPPPPPPPYSSLYPSLKRSANQASWLTMILPTLQAPLDSNKFPSNWRKRWPWEQAQMYPIYEELSARIMRLSFPSEPWLPWKSTKDPKSQYPTDAVEPWCFSHWPGANCFITHYCSSVNQKARLTERYQIKGPVPIKLNYIDNL